LLTNPHRVPPGKHLDSWWTQLRSGTWRLYFQLSAEGKKRLFREIVPLLHDTKTEVLGDRDHEAWYLVYLGTKPNSQGRGYAARLLQDVMARVSFFSSFLSPWFFFLLALVCLLTRNEKQADAENRPMYLESSSQANNAYYEKFGFEVKRDVYLERGAAPVRLSIMVREPRVSGCKVEHANASPMVKKLVGVKGLRG
jgi:ribosomal protein S18 acetylase RimI-like enzyme